MTRLAEDMIFQFLSTNGDGTGDINAIGDYSSVQGEFYISPPSGQPVRWWKINGYKIYRMLVFIQAIGPLSADQYGNLKSLQNGIKAVVKDDSDNEILDLTAGQPVKTNAQWAQHCYDSSLSGYGSGNEFVQARWTFEKSGNPILLKEGYRLSVLIDDDLTETISHTFVVQGERL